VDAAPIGRLDHLASQEPQRLLFPVWANVKMWTGRAAFRAHNLFANEVNWTWSANFDTSKPLHAPVTGGCLTFAIARFTRAAIDKSPCRGTTAQRWRK